MSFGEYYYFVIASPVAGRGNLNTQTNQPAGQLAKSILLEMTRDHE